MQSENSRFPRLFSVLFLAIIVAITFVSGCRLIGVGDDDSAPAAVSTITGRVVESSDPAVSQRGSARPALLAEDITGAVGIAGAEVWLEDLASDPRYRTTSDASGTYRFSDVPAGSHRIIVKYVDPKTGKLMKRRSAALQVTDTPAVVEAPDLAAEPALNVVTGLLRDAEGNFLPEGTVLTLWGETFTVGKDGAFTSPALPASAGEAEIFVQLPGGNNTTSFTAPFVSDVVPAFVELKVGAGENGNHAPTVVVSASVAGKAVSKVNPGTVVKLVAAGSDVDSGDQAALNYTWSVTSGTLADGASALEKLWTAPDHFTVATISVEVKDPENATGKAQLPILVGIDTPSQVDTGRPTVTLVADVEVIAESAAFNVTITFNEPVTGFELSDISVTNAALSEFSTVTAGKVFKIKVTPQAAGEVKVSVAENVAIDLSNNQNTASDIITLTNTVSPPKSSEKAITAFGFPALSVNGTVNGTNIAVTVPIGTDVTALVANFTASAKATVKVGDVAQVSGETANNFSSPVVYKVTAESGITAEYTITVTVTQPAQITALDLTSLIVKPVKGAAPVTTAIDAAQYTSGAISWFEADGTTAVVGNFAAAKVYVAKLTLTAKVGYTLTGVAANSFTYTGATSAVNAADSGAVTITFPATADAVVSALDLTALLTKPVKDAVPVTTAIDAAQYTSGAISWFEADGTTAVVGNFAAAKVYVAKLTLTAKAGYTLTGVAANSFTYTDASVVNAANSGVITVTFSGIVLLDVPGGTFQRDATSTNLSTVSGFRMSKYEITRTQFLTVMGSDPSNAEYSTGVDDPVHEVNWYHAIAFCNKLSIAEGLTPVYAVSGVNFSTLTFAEVPTADNAAWTAATCNWSANGYRLPTDMEWMWAAMGANLDSQPGAMSGGVNVTGYTKAFAGSNGSNSLADYVWYCNYAEPEPWDEKSHPVGSELPNELGLHDMSGNAWEWCWDWVADDYPAGTLSDYRGADSGLYRKLRGRHWDSNDFTLYVSKWGQFPNYQGNFYSCLGFRVVRP